jgi:hypothetical protein
MICDIDFFLSQRSRKLHYQLLMVDLVLQASERLDVVAYFIDKSCRLCVLNVLSGFVRIQSGSI